MGRKYQRQNGESMQAFRARCAEAEKPQLEKSPVRSTRRRRKKSGGEWCEEANRVDGYDRDDLGESLD